MTCKKSVNFIYNILSHFLVDTYFKQIMVRLKKTLSENKMASFEVSIRSNDEQEEFCEIRFVNVENLKVLFCGFENKPHTHFYIKDLEIINEDIPPDVITLQYNMLNVVNIYHIRFGSVSDKEAFLNIGFPDR